MISRGRTDQWLVATIGVGLLIFSLAGLIYAGRVTGAHVLYYRAKYGAAAHDPARALHLIGLANRLYRHNYHACLLAVETAYGLKETSTGADASAWSATARGWCERGLAENPYRRRLRWFMCRLLWEDSPESAVQYWEAYTAWHFWEPLNHAMLARMYVLTGRIEKAERSLAWARGAETYDEIAALVAREKTKQHTPDRAPSP